MKLVDSHCHLDMIDLAKFGGDLDGVLEHAREQGVCHMLCVSVNMEDLPAMQRLVEPYPDVSTSVGVHPNERHGVEPEVDDLVRMSRMPKVVAIGETGLDYFRVEGRPEWQRDRFRRHIAAARKARKPLIVHSRDAFNDTVRILASENAAEAGGVMHCFTGNWTQARKLLDLGFDISFSGIVTFNSARDVREAATRVPLDRLLVETDSPYLAPVPHRGRGNRPGYVRHVAECIAGLRGVSVEEIAEATTANFERRFGLSLGLDTVGAIT
ncbi:MAG: TatD family hydrolase [Gammaproteobacteria bacterium]|nr:TatD family hydrolase [Gammaproteobacteria bacterium]